MKTTALAALALASVLPAQWGTPEVHYTEQRYPPVKEVTLQHLTLPRIGSAFESELSYQDTGSLTESSELFLAMGTRIRYPGYNLGLLIVSNEAVGSGYLMMDPIVLEKTHTSPMSRGWRTVGNRWYCTMALPIPNDRALVDVWFQFQAIEFEYSQCGPTYIILSRLMSICVGL